MLSIATGQMGTGKTLQLHRLARESADSFRILVAAHNEDWQPEAPHWDGNPPPIKLYGPGEGIAPDEPIEGNGIHVFYSDAIDIARKAIWLGNTIFVDDEADMVANRNGFRAVDTNFNKYDAFQQVYAFHPLWLIANQGRHIQNREKQICQVHALLALRRVQDADAVVIDNAKNIYVFRSEGRAAQMLVDRDKVPRDELETIRKLPDFVFFHTAEQKYYKMKIDAAIADKRVR